MIWLMPSKIREDYNFDINKFVLIIDKLKTKMVRVILYTKLSWKRIAKKRMPFINAKRQSEQLWRPKIKTMYFYIQDTGCCNKIGTSKYLMDIPLLNIFIRNMGAMSVVRQFRCLTGSLMYAQFFWLNQFNTWRN